MFENILNAFLSEINLCKLYNQSYSTTTQLLSERLSVEIFGFRLAAKKGYSFDTDQNDELKSCEYLQPKKCKKCGLSSNFFEDSCICGNDIFSYNKGDSRWGIDAKSHEIYFDKLNRYILFLIECNDIEKMIFSVKGWIIDKNNEHFNYILKNQSNAIKSNHLNFLPYSHDFFRSSPYLFLDIVFCNDFKTVNFLDIKNPKKYLLEKRHFEYNNKILTADDIEKITGLNKISKKELINNLFENGEGIDLEKVLDGSKRNKNLDKERGKTKREL